MDNLNITAHMHGKMVIHYKELLSKIESSHPKAHSKQRILCDLYSYHLERYCDTLFHECKVVYDQRPEDITSFTCLHQRDLVEVVCIIHTDLFSTRKKLRELTQYQYNVLEGIFSCMIPDEYLKSQLPGNFMTLPTIEILL